MINGLPRTVVEIMAPDFKLPQDFALGERRQIWLPIRFNEDSLGGRSGHYLQTVTRLVPGVAVEQATADLNSIANALTEQGHYPPERNFRASVAPVTDEIVGEVRPTILVLFGAVGLVLGQLGLRALIALDPASVPRLSEVTLDPTVLVYATVVSVGTGLLFGLAPVLRSGRVDMQSELKEGGRGFSGGGIVTARTLPW